MVKISKEELSQLIDSAWQNGMNSDEMAEWLLNTVFAENWCSIETAPKDEEQFLAWFSSPTNPSFGFRAVTYWDSVREEFYGTDVDSVPILWIRLPKAPIL